MTSDPHERLEALVRAWNLAIEETLETNTSVLGFGWYARDPVVLKVVRNPGDEWRSGEIAKAFNGRGVVRVLKAEEGAVLLERILPGNSLVPLVLAGRDDDATEILAGVIQEMAAAEAPVACTTVEAWANGFDRYLGSSDLAIPRELVEEGRDVYQRLCGTQRSRRLLHGDLHHENVLFDDARGWLAIDPKGVLGEIEYEVGAALRNPVDSPKFFSPKIFKRRIQIFGQILNLDVARTAQWAFAQAVLSGIWSWEDGNTIDRTSPVLRLACEVRDTLLR
jgi:streptomycin 6-kinase